MKQPAICFLLTILTVALFSGCSAVATNVSNGRYKINIPNVSGDIPTVEFKLDSTLPALPANVPVYKMIKPEITLAYINALSLKFGLTGQLSEGPDNFLVSDNSNRNYLDVYKATGTFRYTVFSKVYPNEKPILPSGDESIKIAMKFLTEKGLLPEGRIADRAEVGGTKNGYPAHLLVSFTSDIHATGPGARMGVRVGNDGEIVEVFINPVNPSKLPVREIVALRPMDESLSQMETDKKYYVPDQTKKVHIDSVSIAYWLEPIDKGQDYVVPVYVFKGYCVDTSGKRLDEIFTGISEAVN